MALVTKEWLSSDAVDDTNLKLRSNNYLKSRNADDDGDVNIVKCNADDAIEFASVPIVSADPGTDNSLTRKSYITTLLGSYQATSAKDQANGYAGLDAGGKVLASALPSSVMEFKGAWNATTNSPTLADGTGDAGDVYRVSVAGTQNLGSGALIFGVGDWCMYNGTIWQRSPATDAVTSVNTKTGAVSLTADDVPEAGSPTNVYFTATRAKTAAVVNSTAGTETDQAASVSAMKSYVSTAIGAITGADAEFEVKTLIAGDITAGYIDLGYKALADSVMVTPVGGPLQVPTVDYTLNYTGGTGGVTRVTFAGDLAAKLVATDKLAISYLKG